MSGKKKSKRAVDLYKSSSKEIVKDYEEGMHYKDLAKKYECSANTMMITIGILGFKVEPWAEPQVKLKIEQLKQEKANRVRQTTGLDD